MPQRKPRRVCGWPGCENLCKRSYNQYCCPEHVPISVRIAGAVKGRKQMTYRQRAEDLRESLRIFRAER